MKIVIAPDSFKGNCTAKEAADYIEKGMLKVLSRCKIDKVPMADGGEGTVQAIVDATGGKFIERKVKDPLGRRIKAKYGITGDKKTAVIEMAEASGLILLKPSERNPMVTSTFGTGQLINHALESGVKKIIVGIGGSATNDGGTGMARSLGVKFYDSTGSSLAEGGGSLNRLYHIDMENINKKLYDVKIEVACDVTNPLFGKKGAAYMYAPQKGANPGMVRKLDSGLRQLAKIIKKDINKDISKIPGSGAAGGLGAGLMAFAGGKLRKGIDIVIDAVNLTKKIKGSSLVITGEGRIDGQTIYGKTPIGVAREAKRFGIPVIAICGSIGEKAHLVHTKGIDAYVSMLKMPIEESDLPILGPDMLVDCSEEVARILALKIKSLKK